MGTLLAVSGQGGYLCLGEQCSHLGLGLLLAAARAGRRGQCLHVSQWLESCRHLARSSFVRLITI
ncbi:hypothetical protein [Thermogemmatispora tikiterensis]|uniref:Uncharacterized protein n=1 Tax=Thermogemmatispora tikiterensis TaxID=1825093 RepID=A0A328V8L2_9CHLR|nr:hypothetical protein [Thermogemmatispora tikiterensis]RAQ93937.1 hypothetical protein A4R35_00230 [Thermogemmatispora tikiterensis]